MIGASPLALLFAFQTAAGLSGGAVNQGEITLPDSGTELQIVDLGVRFRIPHDLDASIVLGLDIQRAMVLWGVRRARSEILRYDVKTGALLSRVGVSADIRIRHPSSSRARLRGNTDEILFLDENRLFVVGIEGDLINTIELSFAPRTLLAVRGDSAYFAGHRIGSPSPIHLFVLDENRLESPTAKIDAEPEHVALIRHGTYSSGGDLWTVTEGSYEVERWDPRTLRRKTRLAAHPSVLHYLSGAYATTRVVSVHLMEERYLWVFLLLELRVSSSNHRESAWDGAVADFDGLVEVIDLESSEVVVSQFLPELGLAGWVEGPFAYRVVSDGILELIHCGLEIPGRMDS